MKPFFPIVSSPALKAGIVLVVAFAASPMYAVAASSHQAERHPGASDEEQAVHAAQDAAAAKRVPKPIKPSKNPGMTRHERHTVHHGKVKPEDLPTGPQQEVGFAEDVQQQGQH